MEFVKPFVQLGQNILAGTRAAFFLPVYLWSFKSSYIQVFLLLILSLALSFLHDYYDTVPDNYFNPYGLSYQAMLYLLFFFSLSLIAYFNSRLQDLIKLTVLFLSIVPVVWLGTICLLYLSEQQVFLNATESAWAVFIIYLSWYLLIVFRLIQRFFHLPKHVATAYMLIYGIINFSPLFLLPTEPLWYSYQQIEKQFVGSKPINIEKVYYTQAELTNRMMAAVLTHKKDQADLYFVGFAGDAEEGVFMNEAIAAKEVFDKRFNTFGRSVLLVNNEETINKYPLANSFNLEKVLKKIAALMDTENDTLFLFLTSHGNEDHTLSVNFPQFKLNNINADLINTALNDAGIKWRIIVISACYSGGFIDTLANPYTLLITAASAERASFGCGHDGKYTYFGKAFFEEALAQTYSFTSAFENAKNSVYTREQTDGFTSSQPQISLGEKMADKLIELEQGFVAVKSSNWAHSAKE